jgi:hypothetical protein
VLTPPPARRMQPWCRSSRRQLRPHASSPAHVRPDTRADSPLTRAVLLANLVHQPRGGWRERRGGFRSRRGWSIDPSRDVTVRQPRAATDTSRSGRVIERRRARASRVTAKGRPAKPTSRTARACAPANSF